MNVYKNNETSLSGLSAQKKNIHFKFIHCLALNLTGCVLDKKNFSEPKMHIYLAVLIFYGVISVDSLSLLSEDNIVFDDDAGRLVEDHGNGQCTFEIT